LEKEAGMDGMRSGVSVEGLQRVIDELLVSSSRKIHAILITDGEMIPRDVVVRVEHEEKMWILMNKADLEEVIADLPMVKALYPPEPVGVMGILRGIPVYEDDEKIRKILKAKADEYFRRNWERLFEFHIPAGDFGA
jgi:hypothetical protein